MGGIITGDGSVKEQPAGPVNNPDEVSKGTIDITVYFQEQVTFHDHPSGKGPKGGYYVQSPSPLDISNSNNKREYVFGRGDGTVYIFNKNGILATIPQQYFVTPKK